MMLRSATIKLELTQISQRYGRESFRDGFEYIAILIKKSDNYRENQIFPTYLSALTQGFPKGYRFAYGEGVPSPMGGLGGKSPSGIYGFD